jgi:hypothetical protein
MPNNTDKSIQINYPIAFSSTNYICLVSDRNAEWETPCINYLYYVYTASKCKIGFSEAPGKNNTFTYLCVGY